MNKVFLVGNCTRDAELHESKGTQYAKFSLAVKDIRDKTYFFDITCFGKDFVEKFVKLYCLKGTKLLVEGKITVDEVSTSGGTKNKMYGIIAQNIELMKPTGVKGKVEELKTEDIETPF